MARRLAHDPRVPGIVGEDVDFRAPLKLLGGLHYLVLAGQATWDDVPAALDEHADFLRAFVRERSVQTNEVQRSWMLLPCFLEIARRTRTDVFDIIGLGSSAGFNLLWDRYRHVYEHGTWGGDDALLELRGEERAPVTAELLGLAPRVRSRIGVDIEPVDVTKDEEALLLKAFVWPDQTWRLELLDSAIEAVRRERPNIVRGDLVEELPRLLRERARDAVTLVYQTATLAYLPPERRRRVYEAFADAGAEGSFAYVGTHQARSGSDRYYSLYVQTGPEQGEPVADADFHGAWIEWL